MSADVYRLKGNLRRRTAVAIAALLGLSVGLGALVGVPMAGATEAAASDDVLNETPTLEALQDSSKISGIPLVTGRLTADDGVAVAGALVRVEVWPTPEELAEVETGDPFKLVPIAKAVTAADGTFDLRIDPAVDMTALMKGSNFVDADLIAEAGGGQNDGASSFSFSIGRASNFGHADEQAPPPEVALVDLTRRAATHATEVEMALDGSGKLANAEPELDEQPTSETIVESDPNGGNEATGELYDGPKHLVCERGATVKVAHLENRWVDIGNLFAKGSGSHEVEFVYASGADSSIGVGISGSGGFGEYEAGGTVTRERRLNPSTGKKSAPKWRYVDTKFSFGQYCRDSGVGPGPNWEYIVKPIMHNGGLRYRVLDGGYPGYLNNDCVPYAAGASEHIVTSYAQRWGGGAKTAGLIGINLSARTGFTRSAKNSFYFGPRGLLCGRDATPGESPKVVGMRQP